MADNGTVNYTGNNKDDVIKTGVAGKLQRDIAQRNLNQAAYGDTGIIKNLQQQLNTYTKITDTTTKAGQKLQQQIRTTLTDLEKAGETQEVSYTKLKKIVEETYEISKKSNDEQVKAIQKQMKLLNQKDKEQKERYDELQEELNQINQANAEMQDYLSGITDQIDKAGTILKENTKSWSKGISETLGDVSSSLGDLANMFNIDKLANSGLNQFVSSKLDVQNNMMKDFGMTSQSQYLNFKNSLDSTLKDMGNLYNSSDLKTYMSNLFDLGITDTDTAEKMASSSIMATKYLGVSNEVQEQIFKYMKRTNDYDMLDEHNKTITGILSAQLGVSREQLDSLTTIAYGNDTTLASLGMDQQTLQAMNEAEVVSMSAMESAGLSDTQASALNDLYQQYLAMDTQERALFGNYLGSSANQIYATGWSDQSVEGQAKNMQAFVEALSNSGYLSGSGEDFALFSEKIQSVLGNIDTEALSSIKTLNTDEYSSNLTNALTEIADGTKSIEDYVDDTTEITPIDEIQNMLDQFINGIDWDGFTNIVWASAAAWASSTALNFLHTGVTLYKGLSGGVSSLIEGATGSAKLGAVGSGLLATGGGILIGASAANMISSAINSSYEKSIKSETQAAAESLKGTDLEGNEAAASIIGTSNASDDRTGLGASWSMVTSEIGAELLGWTRDTATKNQDHWKQFNNYLGSSSFSNEDKQKLITAWGLLLLSTNRKNDVSYWSSMSTDDISELLSSKGWTKSDMNNAVSTISDYFINLLPMSDVDTEQESILWSSLGLDGYHKNGKYYIPKDNYHALLHKGEMVLNANEAKAIRDGYGIGGADTKGFTYGAYPSYSGHTGIDFNTPIGTPIGSATPGTVVESMDKRGQGQANGYLSFGRWIAIKSDIDGKYYLYAHLKDRLVSQGQHVNAGDLIGYTGNNGNVRPLPTAENPSAGAHLHFQVGSSPRSGNVNPTPYITSSIFNIGDTSGAVSQGESTSTIESSDSLDSNPSSSSLASSKPVITGRRLPGAALSSNTGGIGGAGLVASSVDNGINKIINYLDSIKNEQDIQRELLNTFTRTNTTNSITA